MSPGSFHRDVLELWLVAFAAMIVLRAHNCGQFSGLGLNGMNDATTLCSALRPLPSMGVQLNEWAILFQASVTCVFWEIRAEGDKVRFEPQRQTYKGPGPTARRCHQQAPPLHGVLPLPQVFTRGNETLL